jgi:hypothetical protein
MHHAPARPIAALIDEIAYRFVMTCMTGFGGVVVISALYLTKSAMGIDLMDGPSPLHGFFFG